MILEVSEVYSPTVRSATLRDCFTEFQPGELNVFRARQDEINKFFESSEDLGPPPSSAAKANRMSPAGISMFYGAFDAETCATEVLNPDKKGTALTVAEFINLVPVKMIDFTSINQIPSLFDEDNRHKRPILKFIHSFVQDLSIPVMPDDRVHIEYIPTQVVTEFVKYKLGTANDIKGIMYNSVKNEGGRCVVIFIERENVIDSANRANAKEEHTLMMINDTIVSTLVI